MRFTGTAELVRLLDSPSDSVLRIEIGPGDTPLCSNCTPVDVAETPLVQNGGVLSDARHLPFADKSVSFIVSKNFPWFGLNGPTGKWMRPEIIREKTAFIEEVLKEYERVLADDGVVLLLGNSSDDSKDNLFSRHLEMAQRTDFHAQIARYAVTKSYKGKKNVAQGMFPRSVINPQFALRYEKLVRKQFLMDRKFRWRKSFVSGILLTHRHSLCAKLLGDDLSVI